MIILFLLMLLINAFFYGFGEAILNLNSKDIEKKAEQGDKKSLMLQEIKDQPGRYVNTMLLIISLVNLVAGAGLLPKVSAKIMGLLEIVKPGVSAECLSIVSVILAGFLILYILLTIGMLLPKYLAANVADSWAYTCIGPAFLLIRLFTPLTGLVVVSVKGILALFGKKEMDLQKDVTEESIIDMVHEGHEQGVILASEAEMISNIFELGDKEAQNIMTHRNNIVAIGGETTLDDALTIMLEGENSRYPVYEGNLDHIIGILHLKDAARFHVDEKNGKVPIREIAGLLREPYFIPQTKNVDALFKEMQSEKLQMVIVMDEYGQTFGLVAMEDILEEIVGNIQDEYDEDKEYIEEKGNDEYVTSGQTPLEEIEGRFGITFETEDFETLNGFLISKLERIPEPDEEFEVDYQGYHFKILKVENKMIHSVLITKLSKVENDLETRTIESGLDENQK